MIGVDTNILVYAHRADSEFHAPAASRVRELAEGSASWAIPWACLHEFFAVVTHPRIYSPPSTRKQALRQIEAWLASPTLVVLAETEGHFESIAELIAKGKVVGPMVHDAKIAAICVKGGVRQLWSADRDFTRFPGLATVNPF